MNKKFLMYPTRNFSFNLKNDEIFFEKIPRSKVSEYSNWPEKFKKENECVPLEEINFLGFRSDNFIKTHKGLHILFTGCSETWGYSLLKKEMWSNILYKKIHNKEECSGYFNLSIAGTSILGQVTNMFKYFSEYGNPDIIFFNMPDLTRFYSYEDRLIDSEYNDESIPVLGLLVYQYYLMLEQYCNSNNIKLYSFSWSKNTENQLSDNFKKTFYKINEDNLLSFVYEHKKENKSQYAIYARDGLHFGTGFNEYWANFMHKKYLNN
jgi:hypothetical protein